MRGVIVYLTQANHSSYKGRQSQQQLQLSVRLLYHNYNAVQRDDVIFFHTGDVSHTQQQAVLSLCTSNTARFRELPRAHFRLPAWVENDVTKWAYARKFSVGYRHMIRFFTVGLWDTVQKLGYDYVMRLDEDSYIWSPIPFNIFEMMRTQTLDYVYRLATWERGHVSARNMDGFHAMVRRYAQEREIGLGWLSGPCTFPSSAANNRTSYFSMKWCGNMYAIYNNFFATRIGFWRQPEVRDFLEYADRSGTFYTERYGDALWHSAALSMFLPTAKLKMLDSFAYEHATLIPWAPRKPGSRRHYFCRGADGNVVDVARRHSVECPIPFFDEGNKVCLTFGGIALAASDVPQPAAMSRVANLSLALLRCPEMDTLYRFTCVAASGEQQRSLQGIFAARVTLEQADCTREPKPFYCVPRPYNASMFSTVGEELADVSRIFDREIEMRRRANDLRRPAWRAESALMHTIDQRFMWRQQRAACINWCSAPAEPSPRELQCHRRAESLFLKLARVASMRVLSLSSPPPAPPGEWSTSNAKRRAYRRWQQRLQATMPPSEGQDPERWKFADGLVAPGRRLLDD